MKAALTRFLDQFLVVTRLQMWPVRVRAGVAAGARWTLYPWSAYWRSTQEPAMHTTLAELGDITGWSCWDLGAHFGIYSVGLGRRVGPTGEIAAFEPNPLSYARLCHHLEMNALTWAKRYEAAVSDVAGVANFYTYDNLKDTTTHLPYEGEVQSAATKPIPVRLLQLDALVASGELRAPDLIKVDVEGHAHKALAGARRTIIEKRPILIVAFHSELELSGVRALLDPLGYDSRIIGTPSESPDAVIGHDLLFTPRH